MTNEKHSPKTISHWEFDYGMLTNFPRIIVTCDLYPRVHGKITYEWHTDDIQVHTSDITDDIRVHTSDTQVHTSDIWMTYEYIRVTYEYIRVAYGWHTSTCEWHTDDIRVHTSDIRMTYEYIRVTYGWHTSTYKWHTNDMRVHTDDMWFKRKIKVLKVFFFFKIFFSNFLSKYLICEKIPYMQWLLWVIYQN